VTQEVDAAANEAIERAQVRSAAPGFLAYV
jgi:hypothetical protein